MVIFLVGAGVPQPNEKNAQRFFIVEFFGINCGSK